MDIEKVKANLAKAQQYCRGNWTQLYVLPVVLNDLPDAIELIERTEELLRVVSMQSDHVDCDGPGCWWCGAESGTSHAKACAVDAVLAKVGSPKKTP